MARKASAPESDAAATETQSFVATCVVVAAAGTAQPGETIALSRDEYDTIAPLGAIEGEWTDAAQ